MSLGNNLKRRNYSLQMNILFLTKQPSLSIQSEKDIHLQLVLYANLRVDRANGAHNDKRMGPTGIPLLTPLTPDVHESTNHFISLITQPIHR